MRSKNFGKIRKDLTGKVFSRLTVVKFDSFVRQGSNRVSFWLCQCICGNLTKVKGTHLTRGDTKSCGCYNPQKLPKGEASFNRVYENYYRHAITRKYEWNLTKEEFKFLTTLNCFYCGAKPANSMLSKRGNGEYIYNGIDRKDNCKGYSLENCVASCYTCNRMKSDLTLEKFIDHIKNIIIKMNSYEAN